MNTCLEKCVSLRYKTPDLQTGEISCSNRCVARYVQSYALISKIYDEKYLEAKHSHLQF